jgi:archaemetzincin
MEPIRLQPVGEGVALEALDELATALARTFSASCHVAPQPIDAAFAFDRLRSQYYATLILEQLSRMADGQTRLLGITELDLFVPVLTFVFGEAQLGGHCALISRRRLREEFYGLPPNPEALRERTVKEAVHELGHTFGLRHCPDWRCVMASTHAVERVDVKSADFCARCAKTVSAGS